MRRPLPGRVRVRPTLGDPLHRVSQACPFGAIPSEFVRGVAPKCDLCIDRVQQGDTPRCVATCTAGALSFVDPEETIGSPSYVGGRIQSRGMVRRP